MPLDCHQLHVGSMYICIYMYMSSWTNTVEAAAAAATKALHLLGGPHSGSVAHREPTCTFAHVCHASTWLVLPEAFPKSTMYMVQHDEQCSSATTLPRPRLTVGGELARHVHSSVSIPLLLHCGLGRCPPHLHVFRRDICAGVYIAHQAAGRKGSSVKNRSAPEMPPPLPAATTQCSVLWLK